MVIPECRHPNKFPSEEQLEVSQAVISVSAMGNIRQSRENHADGARRRSSCGPICICRNNHNFSSFTCGGCGVEAVEGTGLQPIEITKQRPPGTHSSPCNMAGSVGQPGETVTQGTRRATAHQNPFAVNITFGGEAVKKVVRRANSSSWRSRSQRSRPCRPNRLCSQLFSQPSRGVASSRAGFPDSSESRGEIKRRGPPFQSSGGCGGALNPPISLRAAAAS